MWALVGSRPRAVRQTQYEYVYVIGATCAATGQAEAIIAPYLNTQIINQFLQQFSQSLDQDVQAVLLWDGAGYHRSKELVVPDNISLINLPPYSPELNPIENLWHYLKSHCWSNRAYQNYDELFDAAEQAWNQHCLNPLLIKSVCNAPYLNCEITQ